MPWSFPFTESMKKRACRYVLQHYIGQYLEEQIQLDQLSLDLFNGRVIVTDVNLDVVSLNNALDEYKIPIEIVDGFIGKISVNVPWSTLLSDNSIVEVQSLELTIQPKERSDDGGLAFDSMLFSSMTTSMQLAEECLKQERTEGELKAESAKPFDGLINFAQTIETVLSKIKVCFLDTVIRLEHVQKDSSVGAALELKISRLEYFDDLASGKSCDHDERSSDKQTVFELACLAIKNLHLTGVKVYCDELKAEHRTMSRTLHLKECQDSALHRMDSFCESAEFSGIVLGHQPVITGQPIGNGWSANHDTKGDESPIKDSEPVLIAVLNNKQEIKLKIKQADDLPGAKLELECNIDGANVFVSPRLVHLLTEIVSGISSPGTCDNSNVRRTVSKKMVAEDYKKVEQELQNQLGKRDVNQTIVSVCQQISNQSENRLSTQNIDDEDEYIDEDSGDDIYMSLANNLSGLSSMESSASSSTPSQTHTSSTGSTVGYSVAYSKKPIGTLSKKAANKKSKDITSIRHQHHHSSFDDPSTELNKMKFRIGFLSVIILHEDPASTPTSLNEPNSTSMNKMRDAAEKFFAKVESVSLTGVTTSKQLAEIRHIYSRACAVDHLALLCKPVTIDVTQQSVPFLRCLKAEVSISLMEIVEAVFDHRASTASFMGFHLPIENVIPEYCELLIFNDEDKIPKSATNNMFSSMCFVSPCLKLRLTSTENVTRNSRRGGGGIVPKTEVQVDLASCKVEVDITLVDRIHALLNPTPSSATNSSHISRQMNIMSQPDHSMFSQAIDDEDLRSNNKKLELQVTCTMLTLDVRFPKVDLSSHQVEKPWWQRSLHPEHLILKFESTKFKTVLNEMAAITELEVTCRSGEGSFQLNKQGPILFIRLGTDELSLREEDGFGWPRMMIRMYPVKQSILDNTLDDKDVNLPVESVCGEYLYMQSEPSPFSSKKVMFESEELLMPGDRHDMMDFQDKALNNTLLSIELSLPSVVAFLPSKDFFEVLYNRVLNDLVLWQPAAPIPVDIQEPHSLIYGASWSTEFVPQLMQHGQTDEFTFCRSGANYDTSSESEDSEDFYPLTEPKLRSQKRKAQNDVPQPSKMCLTLNIGKGSLTAYTPLKDEKNTVRSDAYGEFLLEVEDSCLLAILCHGGDPELQYICSQLHRATLYHNGEVEMQCENPDLDYVLRSGFYHLLPTIYLSEDGIPSKLRGKVGHGDDGQEDMLSLTVKVKGENFMNQKNYLIACGLRGATLRHRMTQLGLSWVEQLMDFFNVADFDIPGYTLPNIVSELHGYLWSCAIDYRPLYLPYKALVSVESFSFSSNIIAESSVSLIRLLLDDAALYLSDKLSVERIDVKNDYVCVVDLEMFELSLHTSSGQNPKYPKIDLKASSNILNIRTCSDSFSALADLINYLAKCGDLTENDDTKSNNDTNSVRVISTGGSYTGSPQLGPSCMEQVPDLMADAMQESFDPEATSCISETHFASDQIKELYFVPSAGQNSAAHSAGVSLSSSMESEISSDTADSGRGVIKFDDLRGECNDEDFCIIDEPGLGIRPRNGEPVIRIHTQQPVKIIENHFHQPLCKTDLLKAPDHFPPAVYRYTLKEISVVWFMFGGHDFQSSAPGKNTSSPKFVPKSKLNNNPQTPMPWQARGGPGRDINTLMELHLNKMRLQHEIFPDKTFQISRQVLLINELEIRDRLALSKINKFLYLYSSGSMPRQSHANMLVIKALHVRPDLTRPNEQECMLRITLQPLRLNIDQDALFFFRVFFTEISAGRTIHDTAEVKQGGVITPGRPRSGEPPSSLSSTPKHAPPVMGVTQGPVLIPPDSPELLMTFDEIADAVAGAKMEQEADEVQEETRSEAAENKAQPVYFKSFVFTHEVPIRLDYEGKWVDMEQGTFAGLLVGLAQLNCSELKLKRLNQQCGLLGVERLMAYAINEWLQDIKKNQLPSLLGGVGPMHSLVQLVHGCIDLFWLPVEQYRKDGRIVRGLQRGANSFMTCTAMSMLELTNRMVQTVQFAAEMAYDMVSPGPSVQKKKKLLKRRRGLTHPADLREGVANAYSIVKDGLCETASNIYSVAIQEHEHKGVTGAIGGVIRQFPSTVIEPVILATEATSNVLGGMRNQLLPDKRKEDEEKWKALPNAK